MNETDLGMVCPWPGIRGSTQVTLVEDKKSMGRAAMLKEVTARATVNHDVGGSDRGMSLATKASFGFMAQNKDDAVQRHHDMRWVTITKMMDTTPEDDWREEEVGVFDGGERNG